MTTAQIKKQTLNTPSPLNKVWHIPFPIKTS